MHGNKFTDRFLYDGILKPSHLCELVGQDSIRAGASGGVTDYIIENAALFDGSTGYLSRTPSAGNRDTWTLSMYVKRSLLSQSTSEILFSARVSNADRFAISYPSTDKFDVYHRTGSVTYSDATSGVFRDIAAWQHIVVAVDTTSATAADRFKAYINGEEITAWSVSSTYPQNADTAVNAAVDHRIGDWSFGWGNTGTFDGYIAYPQFIDGQALSPTDFGETNANGFWIPKAYEGTYGTNGFYLDFSNGANLGEDQSGNGNNWTVNGTITQVQDTPTDSAADGTANYCTLDPLNYKTSGGVGFANGNRQLNPTSGDTSVLGTVGATNTGKRYFEVGCITTSSTNSRSIGITTAKTIVNNNQYTVDGIAYTSINGDLVIDGTLQSYISPADTWGTIGDRMGFAVDFDNSKIYVHEGGTWKGGGDPVAGTGGMSFTVGNDTWLPLFGANNNNLDMDVYFDSADWSHAPTGYDEWSTANVTRNQTGVLADQFAVRKEAGSGIVANIASDRSGWSDWIEIFKRTDAGEATKFRFSDDSSNMILANSTAAATAWVAPSTGTYHGCTMRVGAAYGCFTAQVSHTNGVATNTAHGLTSDTGDFVILMAPDSSSSGWPIVFPSDAGQLDIQSTSAGAATISVDATNATIASSVATGTYRIVVWAADDFKFIGSHVANSNADGPFINTSGKPEWVLAIDAGAAGSETIISSAADSPYNPVGVQHQVRQAAAENTGTYVDFNSNGIKVRTASHPQWQPTESGILCYKEPEPSGAAQLRGQ